MNLSPTNLKNKFIGVWFTSDDLNHRAVRGSILVFFERFIIKVLYFVRTIILARLLFPEDFGLFGLAALAMNIVGVFTNFGFSASIIQEKGDVKRYLNSAWTINVLRSIFLAGLLYFLAPLAGNFFHNENIIPFVRALSLVYLISGFENIGILLLEKEMRFNRIFFYDTIGVLSEVAVLIISAFILRNPWAFVIGTLANKIALVVMSYIVHPFRPRLTFDFSGARHLFKIGKWVGLSGIVAFLISQGDNLTIGKILNVEALGFYQVAFALGTLPAVEIARALGNVLFPLFSKLQNDLERLRSAFVSIMGLIYGITIPAAAGIVILAPEIVKFVYGERWLPMVSALYVIVFVGLLKSLDFVVNPLLVGTGRAKTSTFILIFQAVIMFVLIIPLTRSFGSVGAAWAVLAGTLFAQVVSLVKIKKATNLHVTKFLGVTILPIVSAVLMFLAIIFLKTKLPIDRLKEFIFYLFFGVVAYFAALFVLDRIFGKRFFNTLIWIKQNL